MAEEREGFSPDSPVLPKKGSYNIDFDSLDDTVNPFVPQARLSSSPPIRVSSASPVLDNFDDSVDPFKPKKLLANSPPSSPKVLTNNNKPLSDSQSKNMTMPACENSAESNVASSVNIKESGNGSEGIPKPKKVIKKPKIQSKLKPPKNIKSPQLFSNEIEICDPGFESHAPEISVLSESTPSQSKLSPKKKQSPLDNGQGFVHDASLATGHHFDEHDNLDDQNANEGFAPLAEDLDKNLTAFDKSLQKESVTSKEYAISSDSFSSDIEKPSRPQASHTTKVHKQREDDSLLNTPTGQKQVDSPNHLSPETPQRDISRGSDKKNSSGMEKGGPSQDDGGNNKETVVQLVQVLRYSQSDWKKMKQELELNFQASLLNKEREWSLMLGERDKKIAGLEEANIKLKHTNDEMRMIVADFEKTISQLQAEKEKTKTDSKKTIQNLESERDQAVEDLQSVESAFSDLHRRYEKSKSIIEGFKRNEEQLKQCVDDLQVKLKKAEGKLQAIRSQAEEKLDKANEDIEKIKKSTKQDIVRLEAALKKAELRTQSLEENLQRKEKENQELTAICDELIAKVGS
ncbi:hypothetical protein Btru_003647 [Bulinus truncatus]|nr:hypothetical protein Btru_003647 [Bulinus truncatus]